MKKMAFPAAPLDEFSMADDPVEEFNKWYARAEKLNLPEREVMALATVGSAGQPGLRMVLLRGFDRRGFVFFTNYNSRKGKELQENQKASLLFYWAPLKRQVRVEGIVEKISPSESDAYFASRPRESQLAAWASHQSEPIADRGALQRKFTELTNKFANAPVPRPPHWGGYRLRPVQMEFWQQGPNRLHDRILYRQASQTGWVKVRLYP